MPSLIPLTWQDAAVLHLERASDPWNIQLELGSETRLDPARLRAALLAACRRHPLARARMISGAGHESTDHWEITELEEIPPIPVTEVASGGDLDRVRTELYSPPIALDRAPAFRAQIARTPDEDRLMFAVAHAMVDGIGLLRLLTSVARAYRGEEDPPDPIHLGAARDIEQVIAATGNRERAGRALEGLRKLGGAAKAPARVAKRSADSRAGGGFAHCELDPAATSALNARRPKGTTINDMLLSGVGRAITTWNGELGQDADKIQLFMPVSVRPREWATEIVSNLFSYVSVTTLAADRPTLEDGALAIAEQTQPLRRAARSGGTQDLLQLIDPLPLAVKRKMPHLLTLTGNRFVDTAVVSNLGRAPELPGFESGAPSSVAFTPPYWSAASVSVGAITVEGTLHLGLRHRLTDLDEPSGRELLGLLAAELRG